MASNTVNASGPGILVDVIEQLVDSVTISYAPFNGSVGYIRPDFTLDGNNLATGTDVGATYLGFGLPRASVEIGVGFPILPPGGTPFSQSFVDGIYNEGVFSFVYGQPFPLYFQLQSIVGTGVGSGRATGAGYSSASFYNTAAISDLVLYDANMNPVVGRPTITSDLGVTYAVGSATPEPGTFFLFVGPLLLAAMAFNKNRWCVAQV